jgi:hypothetical protein
LSATEILRRKRDEIPDATAASARGVVTIILTVAVLEATACGVPVRQHLAWAESSDFWAVISLPMAQDKFQGSRFEQKYIITEEESLRFAITFVPS